VGPETPGAVSSPRCASYWARSIGCCAASSRAARASPRGASPWILRPLVGDPRLPTRFLREQAFDENPYMLIVATVIGFVMRALRA
jgi:hypothetical protein